MKRASLWFIACLWMLIAAINFAPGARADEPELQFLSIGTGAASGVYYPTGRLICELFNHVHRPQGLYCSVEATPGSVYNLEGISSGELSFALVQGDVQYAAMNGLGQWQGRPALRLRSVLSFYPEVLTILARRDAGIASIGDLVGKRVNIGNPGSGTRASWDEFAQVLDIKLTDMAKVSELRPDAAAEQLCGGALDASVLVIGHPSKSIVEQLATCDLVMVSASAAEIDKLLAALPYFVRTAIAGKSYGIDHDIQAAGVRATLVTSADVPDAAVYAMTRTILDNLDAMQARLPNLAGLRPAAMATESLTAPLHPGALRALQEAGLAP